MMANAKAKKPQKSKNELASVGNLNALVAMINTEFGDNAIGFARDIKRKNIIRIPTGNISLDVAMGGGLPIGRFIEMSGALSSTKTTMGLHMIREAQQIYKYLPEEVVSYYGLENGMTCALLDIEGTTTESYIKSLGVDVNRLLYSNPDGMEEACDMIVTMQRSGLVHFAMLDSIEALTPIKEYEKDMSESSALNVKQILLGQFLRKYQASNNYLTRKNQLDFTLLGINQLREKPMMMGDPEYTPGGRAKGYYASVELRLKKSTWLKQGTGEASEIIGQTINFRVNKNKTYRSYISGEFDFYFTENDLGVREGYPDNIKSIIMEAVQYGLIAKKGAWYYLKDSDEKFQGMESLVDYLRGSEDYVFDLRNQIINIVNPSGNAFGEDDSPTTKSKKSKLVVLSSKKKVR